MVPTPLGERIDGCRDALSRAKARLQAAATAVAAAQQTHDLAQQQTAQLEAELRELEASVVTTSRQAENSNCIERLQQDMQRVISEMGSSSNVAAEEVQGVLAQMTTLFHAVSTISARCRQEPQPDTSPGHPPTPHQQPPGQPLPVGMETDAPGKDIAAPAVDPLMQGQRLLTEYAKAANGGV